MVNNTWYKKVLIENKKEIISSVMFAGIFALATLLWHFALGKNFEWREISPIPEPSLFVRSFYSALVFITFGAFLYWINFYKFLHSVIVRGLGDWRLYKDIKGLIWSSLILTMYFFVVPKVIDFLNAIISVFYNLLAFILYLLPPLGISLVLSLVGYMAVMKSLYDRK